MARPVGGCGQSVLGPGHPNVQLHRRAHSRLYKQLGSNLARKGQRPLQSKQPDVPAQPSSISTVTHCLFWQSNSRLKFKKLKFSSFVSSLYHVHKPEGML